MTQTKIKTSIAARALGACIAAGIGFAAVPASAQPMSPALRSVNSALRSAAFGDRELAAFYKARAYRPLWIGETYITPDADRLLEMITTAELDGLNPTTYRPDRLLEALEQAERGSPRAVARAEIALSRTLVSYARDLHRPVDTGMTYVDKQLAPKPRTAAETLRAAAASPSPLDGGLGLNPIYKELRKGFTAWRTRWGSLPSVNVATGPSLTIGSKGDRVARLRERLGLTGEGSFDKSLAAAVKEFQSTHGLAATGIADAKTIAALNEGPELQEAKLRLNLKRARALPATRERYVLVDAAEQRLYMYEDGKVRDSMRVIVGRSTEPTPMMAALMRFTVLNPYWNVPPDLVQTRIAPGVLKGGVAHLKKERYEVLSDWTDDAKTVDPKKVDWKAVASGKIELPVRQLPGRANSMGAMKFMFPNEFGVYLHDTPDKNLFGSADRRKSAGCVRLEDAPRLARWLYGTVPTSKSGAPEQHVPLPRPVPVYITYMTAAPAPTGIVFRNDFYGRDKAAATRFAGGRLAAAD